jgi:3-deoxy-manno-octulosonate cytidylyltransferase (CMP-KDO synthetase)
MLSAVGVIPARYGSSRLPGKPLAELQGKPLLYYVYHRASRARTLNEVLIATDDERIFNAAKGFGARVVMTRGDHRSGTDRIAEVADGIDADLIVNIQGDEPLIDFCAIDQAVEALQSGPEADMATLKTPLLTAEELWNPNVVKVVTDLNNYALYFSRSPIPFLRSVFSTDAGPKQELQRKPDLLKSFYRHIGLYVFRRNFLLRFTRWTPTPLELSEDLEQLRALEHGARIKVDTSQLSITGIDTPEDLERIRKMVGSNPELLET